MRPGFNVCTLLVRKRADIHERALRRLTVNRSTRVETPGAYDYIVKGGRAVSFADMAGGKICSASGLWYPASQIRMVRGRPYGLDMAPVQVVEDY